MRIEEMTITGMTCASCSARVEKVVGKLEGVAKASVNLATEKLHIEYDETLLHDGAVRTAVEAAGYGLLDQEKAKHVTIPIGGMTCASCSARIEKVVGKLVGVEKVSVNLATEKADVFYHPEHVRLSAIKKMGSYRCACCPPTLSSSGWLSIVPTKLTPGVVPRLPVSSQT